MSTTESAFLVPGSLEPTGLKSAALLRGVYRSKVMLDVATATPIWPVLSAVLVM